MTAQELSELLSSSMQEVLVFFIGDKFSSSVSRILLQHLPHQGSLVVAAKLFHETDAFFHFLANLFPLVVFVLCNENILAYANIVVVGGGANL